MQVYILNIYTPNFVENEAHNEVTATANYDWCDFYTIAT